MGSLGPLSQLKQIAVAASREGKLVTADDLCSDRKQHEEDLFKSAFTTPHPHVGKEWSDADRVSPYPLLVPEYFVENAKQLQEALAIAVANIVERWAETGEGGDSLSQRMPLQPHEDALLRWIHQKSKEGVIPPFKERMGHWRPDILLSTTDDGDLSFRICEINARFFQNSLMYSMQALTTCSRMLSDHPVLQPTADPEHLLDCLCGLFDPSLPFHMLVGWGKPKLSEAICKVLKERAGVSARVISPSDLRLVPDDTSPTGYRLYADCGKSDLDQNSTRAGLEPVHQVGLYLYQDEFRRLSMEMLQHIALRCVNDIRTILLVADKRILGTVLQELDALVNDYKVLTAEQARILQDGIVPTVLPGSSELKALISQSRNNAALKNEYIIKPCRDAESVGILFGDELLGEEWERLLADMQDPRLYPHQFQYIIQPIVRQPAINISREVDPAHGDMNIVGLYYAFNGRYEALGAWRATHGRLSCYSKGGFRIPSVSMK
ncbi:uncharacterized protein CDV56_101192 [Aspergillus thermomutatus]|uniref:Glutathionylspermidine synthase pre-ATP-grasp-like domain-containing protein n=1 Tax=Aspergillus thermomutatus TaxID=41047 RepID=A0A397G0Q6_ASPTH|nr:uncharacterized protein CDV56_101192 [Aspergillus thermomutatus]RHZ44307.1 hypothetical protein CDV56_101192 [Aspergillus thermomutatus]